MIKRAGRAPGKTARAGSRSVSPARRAAFEILRRVEEGAYATVLLATRAEEMRAEDRALCHELVLGVLRRQLWLDRLIEHYANRPAGDLDPSIRRALRLGLYQLRFLTKIPPSAAVNESVNLAYQERLRSAAGLLNAVLRRALREPHYDPAADVAQPAQRLALETSHPEWLIERWIASFGIDETRALAFANNQTPPTAFRLNPRHPGAAAVLERLSAEGVELKPSTIAPGAWRATGGGPLLRALARAGAIYIQDEASQLVAHVLDARAGDRVLDACAAPGGKTTQIAALAGDQALVVAGDLYLHRLRTVVEAAARQGLSGIHPVALDAEERLPFQAAAFDRVLVDAPCSGTGTLRHNPEIRWRITADDIAELAARQRRILLSAARMVRRGGRLVYSTCSVEREENEDVVRALLEAHPELVPLSGALPERLRSGAGAARTWPHREGADGFFIAAFERPL